MLFLVAGLNEHSIWYEGSHCALRSSKERSGEVKIPTHPAQRRWPHYASRIPRSRSVNRISTSARSETQTGVTKMANKIASFVKFEAIRGVLSHEALVSASDLGRLSAAIEAAGRDANLELRLQLALEYRRLAAAARMKVWEGNPFGMYPVIPEVVVTGDDQVVLRHTTCTGNTTVSFTVAPESGIDLQRAAGAPQLNLTESDRDAALLALAGPGGYYCPPSLDPQVQRLATQNVRTAFERLGLGTSEAQSAAEEAVGQLSFK